MRLGEPSDMTLRYLSVSFSAKYQSCGYRYLCSSETATENDWPLTLKYCLLL